MAVTSSSNSTVVSFPLARGLELVVGGLDAKRLEQVSELELGEAAVRVHVESHEDVFQLLLLIGAVQPLFW
ncbi:hypothetical protein Pyn_33741 [Prunus yedoensis var. nudiflora]|uniref:Uncharacterized protein n=1 Tax=Prunus yedoensis var. nudiflora TaxID=2094558 RepID=A0A314YTW8_PRUYE|nr:hypothetical protein Pyn_33741 [Prunus yedoensis var. nudiflora]